MAEDKPHTVDTLRDILAEADARDADLQKTLETAAATALKDLGLPDAAPEWLDLKAGARDRQVGPKFVLHEKWLRGDLLVTIDRPDREGRAPAKPPPDGTQGLAPQAAPPAQPPPSHAGAESGARGGQPQERPAPPALTDDQYVVNLQVRTTSKHTHEVGTVQQTSEAMVIDPSDEKDREQARKKFAQLLFDNLEVQIRGRRGLPPG